MCPTSSKNLTVHMHTITYVLMILVFLLAKTSANDFNKSREAKALLATNWWGDINASSDHCTWWLDISCNEEGSVIWIEFYCDDNEGLGDLRSLDFASFPNLYYLSIINYKLEGSIPEQIGLLSNLVYLNLSVNQFTGKLPVSFSNLTHLEKLDLSNNNLDGPIPLDIAYLMKLGHLDLHHNRLVGAIHPEFGKLSYPFYLDLSSNQFSGYLSLANPCSLLILNLSENLMTGAITSVRGCRNLEYLDIGGNHFVGEALNHCDFPFFIALKSVSELSYWRNGLVNR